METPVVRYAQTPDSAWIAYCVAGSGPPLIQVATGLWNHAQGYWRIPARRRQLAWLASAHTLVDYDARGTGLSRESAPDFSLEARLVDLDAVVAAAGFDTFDLYALGPATPTAIAYAVLHPDLVSKLVLLSPFTRSRDYQSSPQSQAMQGYRSVGAAMWPEFIRVLAGRTAEHDPVLAGQIAAVQAESMTPESYQLFHEQSASIDVTDRLAEVRVPTLVVQPGGDSHLAGLAQQVAALIPGARLQSAPGAIPLRLWYQDEATAAILDFTLPGGHPPRPALADAATPNNLLDVLPLEEKMPASTRSAGPATVIILFLDIVDSTALTERLGDATFRARSRHLEAALRGTIGEHGGSLVEGKVLGDGVLATFASATKAIEAAVACNESAANSELQLHLGLHAGDVIRENDNVYGGAVNLAARVCSASAPCEVLVSETVRALARTSSGVRFEDRGLHELKGIEEPQRLFAVVPVTPL